MSEAVPMARLLGSDLEPEAAPRAADDAEMLEPSRGTPDHAATCEIGLVTGWLVPDGVFLEPLCGGDHSCAGEYGHYLGLPPPELLDQLARRIKLEIDMERISVDLQRQAGGPTPIKQRPDPSAQRVILLCFGHPGAGAAAPENRDETPSRPSRLSSAANSLRFSRTVPAPRPSSAAPRLPPGSPPSPSQSDGDDGCYARIAPCSALIVMGRSL